MNLFFSLQYGFMSILYGTKKDRKPVRFHKKHGNCGQRSGSGNYSPGMISQKKADSCNTEDIQCVIRRAVDDFIARQDGNSSREVHLLH
jgi:hypothetical protein